jgi:hypothetical protein
MKIKRNIALSDSGFVFNPSTGDSFSVNPIGLELIRLLKEEKSGEDIKTYILKTYEIDEVTFEKDFYDFKRMLEQIKLTDNTQTENS